jgi:hypothetical protein
MDNEKKDEKKDDKKEEKNLYYVLKTSEIFPYDTETDGKTKEKVLKNTLRPEFVCRSEEREIFKLHRLTQSSATCSRNLYNRNACTNMQKCFKCINLKINFR